MPLHTPPAVPVEAACAAATTAVPCAAVLAFFAPSCLFFLPCLGIITALASAGTVVRTPARNVPLRARLVGTLRVPKEKISAEAMPAAKAIRTIDLIYMLNEMYDSGATLERKNEFTKNGTVLASRDLNLSKIECKKV